MHNLILPSLPFFYFLFVASITPGPNNVMLTASGMNFGYMRTIPHMAGIYVGFTIYLTICAFGVGAAVAAYPPVLIALKILGSAYLVYLAWRIVNAGRMGVAEKAKETARPLTFLEAAGFQFINPKGVVFGLAAASLLPPEASLAQIGVIVFIATTISCIAALNTWVLFGKAVATLFRDDKIRRVINIILALLLLATLPMMVM